MKLIIESEKIDASVKSLASYIDTHYQGKNLLLVGIMNGAMYFMVDLSRALKTPHAISYIDCSSYGDEQVSGDAKINGLGCKSSISKFHVIVVDELFDTGKTLDAVVKYINQFNPLSIKTCVAFRKNIQSSFPQPDYIAIDTVPNVWCVGYGLDDLGYSRNQTSLYAIPKAPGVHPSEDDRIFTSDSDYDLIINKITYFNF